MIIGTDTFAWQQAFVLLKIDIVYFYYFHERPKACRRRKYTRTYSVH